MIQRIQSLWLALALLCGAMGMALPLGATVDTAPAVIHNDFFAMSVQFFATIGALVTIFQFKNRRLQMKIAKLAAALFLAAFAWNTWRVFGQTHGAATVKAGLFLAALAAVACLMAHRSIDKDEALVKSIDRLR